jgi:hypothetical protein
MLLRIESTGRHTHHKQVKVVCYYIEKEIETKIIDGITKVQNICCLERFLRMSKDFEVRLGANNVHLVSVVRHKDFPVCFSRLLRHIVLQINIFGEVSIEVNSSGLMVAFQLVVIFN